MYINTILVKENSNIMGFLTLKFIIGMSITITCSFIFITINKIITRNIIITLVYKLTIHQMCCCTAAGLLGTVRRGLAATFTVRRYGRFAQHSQQVFDAVAPPFKLLYMFGLKH